MSLFDRDMRLDISATFFLTYNFLVENISTGLHLKDDGVNGPSFLQSAVHSASSAAAEVASCAILTPAEVIKQNAQVISTTSKATTSSSLAALRMLLKTPGSLFRGYSALVSRNLPFTATQFPVYEELRRRIQSHRGTAHPSLLEVGLVTAVSAASAGALSAALTTPLDMIKTRMMLVDRDGGDGNSKRRGMVETAKMVIRREGARGLWRGGLLRAVWTALGSGLYLGTFECAKIYLTRRRARDG
ncbi:Mitoferrin [Orbilia brochopaga]|nr:Mitoferrin [Drechslerella brochopaga]